MVKDNIRQYLANNGISQTFVSQRTGIHISKVNAILKSTRSLNIEDYALICQALKVPLDTFVNSPDEDATQNKGTT